MSSSQTSQKNPSSCCKTPVAVDFMTLFTLQQQSVKHRSLENVSLKNYSNEKLIVVSFRFVFL